MIQHKKNDLLIGFIASILLSLFVNFSLLSLNYTMMIQGKERFPSSGTERYMLYVSLVWFFGISFILFFVNRHGYKLADKLFKLQKYKSVLLVLGLNLLLFFACFQLYPIFHHSVFKYAEIEDSFKTMEIKTMALRLERKKTEENTRKETRSYIFYNDRHPREKRNDGLYNPDADPFVKPLMTEHIFTFIVVFLGVLLLRLLNSEQQMRLEYERLKREKLQTSYNALMGQINPHFFFNSLNGLNSLIHAGDTEKTLKYLDQLSDVFRYILQSNRKELVTLAEELQFMEAYTYLLSVRYEGKLFFSFQIDKSDLFRQLPILSILPLIENAVKHNIISRQYPLRIDIYTNEDKEVVVSNHIQPKAEDSTGSGIGLKNLWGRYRMLTGKDITITQRKEYFKVSLPLLNTATT